MYVSHLKPVALFIRLQVALVGALVQLQPHGLPPEGLVHLHQHCLQRRGRPGAQAVVLVPAQHSCLTACLQ